MAVVDNCPVRLAGQRHVFDVFLSAVWEAERADHPCGFVKVGLLDEGFDHFIAPLLVRLNERLADLGLATMLLRVVVPPFERGRLWSTSLPSPLWTTPSLSSILRALFLCARFFLTSGVPS